MRSPLEYALEYFDGLGELAFCLTNHGQGFQDLWIIRRIDQSLTIEFFRAAKVAGFL